MSSARRLVPILAALALAVTACADATSTPRPSAEASASDLPDASATASASPEPTAEPSETPSEAPASAVPSFDAGGELAVLPNAEADALFLDRDSCLNRQDGYQLEFPDSWYTNTEIRDVPACSWFSPEFYEVDDFDELPEEIAIEIFWLEGERGFLGEPISREDVTVGLQAAVRVEVGGTGEDPTGDGTSYEYVIRLGPTPEEGPNIVARTDTSMGGDYELNKAVLDRMMTTIEFVGTTQ
jgi:hypothetical protein